MPAPQSEHTEYVPVRLLKFITSQDDLEHKNKFVLEQIGLNPDLLKYKYKDYQNQTIVEIACGRNPLNLERLKKLLGMVKQKMNKISQPAYFKAIENSNFKVLEEVLNCFKNSLDSFNTYEYMNLEWENGLLHLIKNKIEASLNDADIVYAEHVKLLLDNGVPYENADWHNKTAVWWAASKKLKKIVELLLEKNVTIDREIINGPTARKLIIDNKLFDANDPIMNKAPGVSEQMKLIYQIKMDSKDLQINYITFDILMELCLRGSEEFTKQYLNLQSNSHATENNTLNVFKYNHEELNCFTGFIETAAEKGYYKILEFLSNKTDCKITPKIFILLIQKRNNKPTDKTNYENCLNNLLKLVKLKLNELKLNELKLNELKPDKEYLIKLNQIINCITNAIVEMDPESSNTPLYYAVRSGDENLIGKLLEFEPSLVSKNKFDFMPLDFIKAKDLEAHLDNCIAFNQEKLFPHLTVNFKFKTLLPPLKEDENKKLQSKMAAVSYMCVSPKLKHLVLHPLIVMFISMKCKNMWKLFLLDVFVYVLFVAFLLSYIYFIEHPIFYPTFCVLLWITLFLRLVEKVLKIYVRSIAFFRNFENWVEMALILLTIAIILYGRLLVYKNVLAFVVLLCALGFVFMLEHFETTAIYVVMFRRVSWNFCKLFLGSLIMIIAFAICFHILFADNLNNNSKNNTNAEVKKVSTSESKNNTIPGSINITNDEGKNITNAKVTNNTIPESINIKNAESKNTTTTTAEGNNSFNSLLESIFKTMIMATGEYDTGNINFDSNPISSRIIFFLFVFMIGIILFNLLNGLAISDIQSIRNDAEFVYLRERVQHFEYVETLALTKLNFLETYLNKETYVEKSYSRLVKLYSERTDSLTMLRIKLDSHLTSK